MKRLLPILAATALLGCPSTTDGNRCTADSECSGGMRCCAGECRDIRVDVDHCGACGMACASTNGVASCSGARCQITCSTGYGDCNQNAADGCEVSLRASKNHCGTCGRACAFANAIPECSNGSCVAVGCDLDYGNCDNLMVNGCETNTEADAEHCGSCGNACDLENASPRCFAGICQVQTCTEPWGNCDFNHANGCEAWLIDDPLHCGTCNLSCEESKACVARRCREPALLGFGGQDPISGLKADLWFFVPGGAGASNFEKITAAAPNGAPAPRSGHVAVWDGRSGRMIVFGGETSAGYDGELWALSLIEEPPAWQKIAVTGTAPGERWLPCAAHDRANRRMYLFGGTDKNGTSRADLWVLDLATAGWTRLHDGALQPVPEARFDVACAFDSASGKFVLFGGEVSGIPTDETWVWDTTAATPAWQFVATTNSPSSRSGARFFAGTSPVAMFGGSYFQFQEQFPKDVWTFDAASSSWKVESEELAPGTPFGRRFHATSVLGGRRYLYGGLRGATSFDDVWEYDPSTETWTELSSVGATGAPAGKYGATIVALE